MAGLKSCCVSVWAGFFLKISKIYKLVKASSDVQRVACKALEEEICQTGSLHSLWCGDCLSSISQNVFLSKSFSLS